jgi:hypothetical protein
MKRREFDFSSRSHDQARRARPRLWSEQMTERGYYRFIVKEGARSHYWIAAEPAGVTIKSLDDCVLGFDLGPQATHGNAVRVADFLNQNILAITLS